MECTGAVFRRLRKLTVSAEAEEEEKDEQSGKAAAAAPAPTALWKGGAHVI